MKYLSLFSGIGGFELGIENSNVEMDCIGFSEVDKHAKAIYKRRFPTHRDLGDATKIRPEELEDFDLLVGGFPCQAFSYAGKRRGFDDTRGTLFFEIARICSEKKPRYLLLENVPGLLSHDRGRTFKKMLGILAEMGYLIKWQVRNSKNYGVPQNRERLFITGYLREECGREIFCSRGEPKKDSEGCKDVNKMVILHPGKQATRILDENGIACTLCGLGGGQGGKGGLYAVTELEDHSMDSVSSSYPEVCKAVLTPERYEKRQNGRRMKDDGEPMFTLTAQDRHGVFDGRRVRRLTPTEFARLQAFPDDWADIEVDGKPLSDNQKYKVFGNAVTTTVVTHIINEMFEVK